MKHHVKIAMKQVALDGTMDMVWMGPAIWEPFDDGCRFSYREAEKPPVDVYVKMTKDECLLVRKAEHTTTAHLRLGSGAYISMKTEAGTFDIPVSVKRIVCTNDCWRITYVTGNDGQGELFDIIWQRIDASEVGCSH